MNLLFLSIFVLVGFVFCNACYSMLFCLAFRKFLSFWHHVILNLFVVCLGAILMATVWRMMPEGLNVSGNIDW